MRLNYFALVLSIVALASAIGNWVRMEQTHRMRDAARDARLQACEARSPPYLTTKGR